MTRAQRPDETLQEYIYQYSELVKMVTGVEPSQVTSPLVISLFNRHLFNRDIKKSVSKSDYRNLKEAFNSALAAERRAKKYEGLTNDDPTVMAIHARAQVNQTTATMSREPRNTAELNQVAVDSKRATGYNRH